MRDKKQLPLFTPPLPEKNFWVWVSPGAKHSCILGWVAYKDRSVLKIRVHAKPEGGKANEEVLEALAEWFQKPPSTFEIEIGHSSRLKRIGVRV